MVRRDKGDCRRGLRAGTRPALRRSRPRHRLSRRQQSAKRLAGRDRCGGACRRSPGQQRGSRREEHGQPLYRRQPAASGQGRARGGAGHHQQAGKHQDRSRCGVAEHVPQARRHRSDPGRGDKRGRDGQRARGGLGPRQYRLDEKGRQGDGAAPGRSGARRQRHGRAGRRQGGSGAVLAICQCRCRKPQRPVARSGYPSSL